MELEELYERALAAEAAYRAGEPIMEDIEFDALMSELERSVDAALDGGEEVRSEVTAFLATPGGGVDDDDADFEHLRPMLSLAKTTEREDLDEWMTGTECEKFLVTPKLDGVAAALHFDGGKLVRLVTRGNGTVGQDVTGGVDQVSGIAKKLPKSFSVEVRGEIVITATGLKEASAARVEAGKSPFANRRNPVAGALRKDQADRDYFVPMQFVAYSIMREEDSVMAEDLAELQKRGFTTVLDLGMGAAVDADVKGVHQALDAIEKFRGDDHEYLIDGAVIVADDPGARPRLGEGSRTPKWARAFKYDTETATATVEHIEIDVGRTGMISFTAVMAEPVRLAGTEVQRASLHNAAHISEMGVAAGAEVEMAKMGDIIPQVLRVVKPGKTPWTPPTECPRCGSPLDTAEVRYYCRNESCAVVPRLTYAAQRDCADWDGVSESLVSRMVDELGVDSIADIYELTEEQISSLSGISSSGPKLHAAIQKGLTVPLERQFTALAIPATGRGLSNNIVAHFGNLDAIRAASVEELAAVEMVGPKKAQLIFHGLHTEAMEETLDRLTKLGIVTTAKERPAAAEGSPFAGKKVLVTGTLPNLGRSDAKEAITNLGGKASGSVSKSVDVFVVADGAGPKKVEKIEALRDNNPNVVLMTGEEFEALAATVAEE